MKQRLTWVALAAALFCGAAVAQVPAPTATQFQEAKAVEPVAQQTIYFDEQWAPHAKPVTGGFYRKVTGKSAEGYFVVQDFYQDSGKKQIAPAQVMTESGLQSGDNEGIIHGPVVWFDEDGVKTSAALYDKGEFKQSETYFANGKVSTQMTTLPGGADGEKVLQTSTWDENGHQEVEYRHSTRDEQDGTLKAWWPTGKKKLEAVLKGDDPEKWTVQAWDEKGELQPEILSRLMLFVSFQLLDAKTN